jgi:uncharacterized membrane protein YiaA
VAYADLRAERKTRTRRTAPAAPVALNWPVVGAVVFSAGAWIAIADLARRIF